jgi:hypothetical protein
MAFCQMGIPYFNYTTTLCGIRSVDIQGPMTDWKILFDTVGRLRTILSRDESLRECLDKAFKTISTIIYYTFDRQFSVDPHYSTVESFFNDIFHYGANRQCGSGHR